MKLAYKDIQEYRYRAWRSNPKCPLCSKRILKRDAVLDHCHDTGHIRGVLHRNCNSIEGRILQWARRSGIGRVEFLYSLLDYWDWDYSDNPIHPTHLTPKEKEIKRLRKLVKKCKTAKAKERHRETIRKLSN